MTTSPVPHRGLIGHLFACATGAALDNVFRTIIGASLAAIAVTQAGDAEAGRKHAESMASWAMILFVVPFVVLAPLAGSLGERLPRHLLIRACRLADVVAVGVAIFGLYLHSTPLLLGGLTLFAVISSFFAPVKLAVVPDLCEPMKLSQGNGWLAAVTVLAILIGTAAASVHDPLTLEAMGVGGVNPILAVVVVAVVILIPGIIGAWRVPVLEATNPKQPLAWPLDLRGVLKSVHAHGIGVPAWCLALFWAIGAVAMVGLTSIATSVFHLQESAIANLSLILAGGLIGGSLLAPYLMHRAYPAGLPILGAALTGLGLLGAGWAIVGVDAAALVTASDTARHAAITHALWPWMLLCGFGGGLWEVPLTVLLQQRSPEDGRNQVMAGVTVLSNFATVALVGGLSFLTSDTVSGVVGHPLHYEHAWIALGGVTLAGCLTCLWIYRLQVTGWLITVIARLWWRSHTTGMEHLPMEGGAVLVCNHLSFADGLALMALLPRRPRFLVYRAYFNKPLVGFFLHAAGCIPVAAEDSRRALLASIDAAVEAAKAGELVALFPEGKLTRSGTTDRFRGGVERIASRSGVPVVPAWLSGFWGSAWSKDRHWRVLHLERARLRLGAPLPSTVTAGEARSAVINLSFDETSAEAERDPRSLGQAALALGRRHPFAISVHDAQGTLPAWKALAAATALVPHLEIAVDETRVGVVLPPGQAGTIVNLALALAGKTAVNLNHTTGTAQLARMCELAEIRTVISAGIYLRKIGDPVLPGRLVKVETILPRLNKMAVLGAAFLNWVIPARWRIRVPATDVATIVFSSGSTGDPKGVQLTHRQILANCRSVVRGLDLHPYQDVLCSPLPLFHSFGLIPGMWLGLTHGITVVGHPDPRDGETIGKLIAASKATFVISTPSFVRGWMRRVAPEQLASLRFSVVGAERCPAELKKSWREKYNSELLEGYGCTELAPVVGLNLLDMRRDGEVEIRNRDGSVGRALPGIQIFTVDPETNQPLKDGAEGLLVVRSPARMLGYLHRDDLTQKAFMHGGYCTGDVGRIDDEGFIFITGRLARFAKIAGEMVPLDTVEAALVDTLHGLNPDNQVELAVSSVPDETKGERLVVLHTGPVDSAKLIAGLETQPALWKPKTSDFKQVEGIPKLGTGKRDLAALKKLAAG